MHIAEGILPPAQCVAWFAVYQVGQRLTGSWLGAGQVLMGTDYPYDMADSDPIGHLASAGLDDATFAAIAGGNARRLFGL